MSTQLAALGIDVIEGYEPDQLALEPDVFVVGNVMSRGNALMEAMLDSGARTNRARVAGAQRAAGPLGARRRRHARQDDDDERARVDPRARRARPGFLVGGVPLDFQVSARLGSGHHSSSRPTSTTPRSSTSARSSSTTGRAPRS
jgi:UDP-N-acetylmuramate: L-alanyl-gamma-D-glutamyl-meso-diaminopimelate ligase